MQTSADQTTAVHCRLQCLDTAQHTRGHIFSVNLPGFLLCGGGDGLGAAVGDCQDIVAEIHSNKMIMSARFTARADIYHIYHIWCTSQPIFYGQFRPSL